MSVNHEGEKKVFEIHTFCIIPNDAFDEEYDAEIRRKLLENGAVEIEGQEATRRINVSALTIIISDDILFPEFGESLERMVPVVKREWVNMSVERQQAVPLRLFSPDPKLFFSSIAVKCVGLDSANELALFNGFSAWGGSWTNYLTNFTTHVVAPDLDHDVCRTALSFAQKGRNIKVVSPQWIADCLTRQRLLDDGPYFLTLSTKPRHELPMKKTQLFRSKTFYVGSDLALTGVMDQCIKDIITLCGGSVANSLASSVDVYIGAWREGTEYYTASRNNMVVGTMTWIFWMVLQDRWTSPLRRLLHYPLVRKGLPEMNEMAICVTHYTGDARKYIQSLIQALGAKFTKELRDSNTHLITARPIGKKYCAAKSWNINTVNHLWLEETYAAWELKSIAEARFIPSIRKKDLKMPIGQMGLDPEVLKRFYEDDVEAIEEPAVEIVDNSPISEEKKALENETSQHTESVESLHTNPVESQPTKPIESLPTNPVESPLAKPIELTESESPLEQDTSVGDENVDPESIVASQTKQSSLSPSPSPSPTPTPVLISSSHESTTKSHPTTPLHNKEENSLLLSHGGSSRRKAKDKAAAKLHQDISDLNEFQKRRRTREIPLLPEEIRNHEHAVAVKKHKTHPPPTPTRDSSSTTKHAKKLSSHKSESIFEPFNLLITGVESTITNSNLKHLSKLGISLVSEAREATHVIAPRICRTHNFLVSLAHGPILLDRSYLADTLASTDSTKPLEVTKKYLLKDKEAERTTLQNHTIQSILETARALKKKGKGLLTGYTFNLAPGVRGGFDVFNSIVIAHGAEPCVLIKSASKVQKICVASESGKVVLIATPEQQNYISSFKECFGDTAFCYTADWVFLSILRMRLVFEEEGAL